MKHRFSSGVLIANLMAGCAGEASIDDSFAERSQAITGGTLLTEEQNIGVDAATVKLSLGCTGTKIGVQRFLTAAHCVPSLRVGDTIAITNGLSGNFEPESTAVLTVSAVHVHPTNFNPNPRQTYDVALIDTVETSPGLPLAAGAIHTPYVEPGTEGALTAYGCDLNSGNGGQKQWAPFVTTTRGVEELDTFWSWASGDDPQVCPGDSGGPLFVRVRAGVWRIAGVVTGGGVDPQGFPGSSFARVGNVRQWITNPGHNVYANQQRGFFINQSSNHCIGIDVAAPLQNGASARQYWCDGRNAGRQTTADHQYWILEASGNSWRFRNTNSNRCLEDDVLSNSAVQRPCSMSSRQLWDVGASGTYRRIRNVASGECLIATSDLNGALIGTVSCFNQQLQSWVFSN